MTRIPDPIERCEARMESWAAENMNGDIFICPGCDKECAIDDAQQMSPDPYGLPACPQCFEDHFNPDGYKEE